MNKVISFYTKLFVFIGVLLSPIIYLLIFLKRRTNNQNILIIPQFKRIGDIVCSTPVFRAIKTKYPNSKITVVVSSMAEGILKNNPRIDEIIVLEDYEYKFPGLIFKIIGGNFSWGISLSGTALSSTLFFLGLVKNRSKVIRPNRPLSEIMTDWMCNKKEEYNKPSYLPSFYLKMLHPLDVLEDDTEKEVFFGKKSEERVKLFLEEAGVFVGDKIVGISLTAGNKVKEWGDEKFTLLVRKILDRHQVKVVVIGSSYDKSRVDEFIKNLELNNSCISAVGVDLEDLPSLMRRFSVFIAVDTGPVHIAHALGIPLIDILGPVNDIELTPKGDNVKLVKPAPNIPASVFAFKESGPTLLIREVLDSISVEQVFNIFSDLYLNKNNGK